MSGRSPHLRISNPVRDSFLGLASRFDFLYRTGWGKRNPYLPILEDRTGQVSPTFDQLLDQLMENKKGLAEGALQRDEFLQPRESEDDAGLQVFSGLEASVSKT
jgi:hypothetical protein